MKEGPKYNVFPIDDRLMERISAKTAGRTSWVTARRSRCTPA